MHPDTLPMECLLVHSEEGGDWGATDGAGGDGGGALRAQNAVPARDARVRPRPLEADYALGGGACGGGRGVVEEESFRREGLRYHRRRRCAAADAPALESLRELRSRHRPHHRLRRLRLLRAPLQRWRRRRTRVFVFLGRARTAHLRLDCLLESLEEAAQVRLGAVQLERSHRTVRTSDVEAAAIRQTPKALDARQREKTHRAPSASKRYEQSFS
mmetsp:Transcript_7136/g.23666  ORF Transcript_7136/g.23666 Transcript_7136/m.23666 type:complete len:215 (+) Transcript_7136:61-705(+)